jgi:hypothetical protein
MELMSSWCNDGDRGEGRDVEGNVGVCLRSELQAAAFLSLRGDTLASLEKMTAGKVVRDYNDRLETPDAIIVADEDGSSSI